MSLTLVSNPTYDAGAVPVSAVAAGLSQLPYLFSRQDYEVFQILNVGGNAQLGLTTDNVTAQFTIGDSFYFVPPSATNYIEGAYTITGVVFATTRTRITLELPYTANEIGYGNLMSGSRVDYKVVIEIRDAAGALNLFPISFKYQTTNSGRLFIDIALVMRDFMLDPQVPFIQYLVRYQEFYTGALIPSAVNDVPIMAIASKKQQLDFGGANLWDQLLNRAGTYLGWDRASPRFNGTGFLLPTSGLNNTGAGTRAWSFTTNDIRINGIGNVNNEITNQFYFEPANFIDDAIPRGSKVNWRARCVYGMTNFTSAGSIRMIMAIIPNGADETTSAGVVIAVRDYQIPSLRNPWIFQVDFSTNSSTTGRGIVFRVQMIGGTFSGNLTFDQTSVQTTIGGRVFLTKYKRPATRLAFGEGDLTASRKRGAGRVWQGWARRISWIMDPDFAVRTSIATPQKRETDLNINLGVVGPTRISEFPATPAIQTSFLAPNPDNNDAVRYTAVVISQSGGAGVPLSEEQMFRYVKVEEQCKRPLMIEWENSLGGLDQHLFGVDQSIIDNSEEGIVFESPIVENFEIAHSSVGRIVDRKLENITATAADLSVIEFRALQEIKSSNYVAIWLDTAGTNYVQVQVLENLQTTWQTKNRDGMSISITFTMPKNFSLYDSGIYDLLLE